MAGVSSQLETMYSSLTSSETQNYFWRIRKEKEEITIDKEVQLIFDKCLHTNPNNPINTKTVTLKRHCSCQSITCSQKELARRIERFLISYKGKQIKDDLENNFYLTLQKEADEWHSLYINYNCQGNESAQRIENQEENIELKEIYTCGSDLLDYLQITSVNMQSERRLRSESSTASLNIAQDEEVYPRVRSESTGSVTSVSASPSHFATTPRHSEAKIAIILEKNDLPLSADVVLEYPARRGGFELDEEEIESRVEEILYQHVMSTQSEEEYEQLKQDITNQVVMAMNTTAQQQFAKQMESILSQLVLKHILKDVFYQVINFNPEIRFDFEKMRFSFRGEEFVYQNGNDEWIQQIDLYALYSNKEFQTLFRQARELAYPLDWICYSIQAEQQDTE